MFTVGDYIKWEIPEISQTNFGRVVCWVTADDAVSEYGIAQDIGQFVWLNADRVTAQ